ncbi:RING-H2 finger protein ATL39-like [Nicotiana tomentosiformis]|uniref:RING-H2 finger protein ATL39-like n=1 Tax=Nicotiana tomentosiformis TaxID=4098 RepID=UPI00388C7DF5
MSLALSLALWITFSVTVLLCFAYCCWLIYYVARFQPDHDDAAGNNNSGPPVNGGERGLSAEELEQLPRITGEELATEHECAVCLSQIKSEELARVITGCNHVFHQKCADIWLSKHPICPVCRNKLETSDPPETSSRVLSPDKEEAKSKLDQLLAPSRKQIAFSECKRPQISIQGDYLSIEEQVAPLPPSRSVKRSEQEREAFQ